jgi:hypothetical protein
MLGCYAPILSILEPTVDSYRVVKYKLPYGHTTLMDHIMLLQHGSVATAGFVGETLNPILEKPFCPLVHKATADTHSVGNMGDGYTISHE